MNDYGNMFQNNGTGFVGFVREGKIYNSNGQQVGYTTDEFNKLMSVAKGYEQKLYDAGILTKPKTPEEINQELQKTLTQMQTTMIALVDKVQKLEGDNNGQEIRNDDSEQIHGTGEQPEIK